MRSATLKWILLVSVLLITTIVAVQLYWLSKVYRYEEKEFNNNVVKSIRGLFEDISIADFPAKPLQKLVENPNPDSYIIRISHIPVKDSLSKFLNEEFQDAQVFSDCWLGVYSVAKSDYDYQVYLPAAASRNPLMSEYSLPLYQKDFSYLHLYFPHRRQYILKQLSIWIGGTALLLLSLAAFSIILFFFYKQKTLNEIQRDFVNNFTHEFKTPLAVMKLATDVLVNPSITQQPERLKKYGSIIKQQTEHLQQQVEKLLKTARTDVHELPLEKSWFIPNELIYDVLQEMDPLIQEKKVLVEVQLEENSTAIFADKSNIGMVLVNLIENSIKYAKHPQVVIATNADNGHYEISVKDNGIGIDKKYHKFLFKKFYRVPTGDVHNVKGFGLGLNFVKKVIDAHVGKIGITSLPGIGTEFKIALPKQ